MFRPFPKVLPNVTFQYLNKVRKTAFLARKPNNERIFLTFQSIFEHEIPKVKALSVLYTVVDCEAAFCASLDQILLLKKCLN